MLLFLFIFSSCTMAIPILFEVYKNPSNHILIRCGQELMTFPRVVKAVNYVTPFTAKYGINPLKFLVIIAYLITFLLCLTITVL